MAVTIGCPLFPASCPSGTWALTMWTSGNLRENQTAKRKEPKATDGVGHPQPKAAVDNKQELLLGSQFAQFCGNAIVFLWHKQAGAIVGHETRADQRVGRRHDRKQNSD